MRKWEVTIAEFQNHEKIYKVTRKLHHLSIAETKIFKTKEEARKQVEQWLD